MGDFRDTPSSQLTIDEFQTIDLEEEQDPPSFTQARKRAKQQLEELNKPEIASELEQFQNSIEKILGIDSKKDKPLPADESGHTNNASRTLETDANSDSSLVVPPLGVADLMSKTDSVDGIWNLTEMVPGFKFQPSALRAGFSPENMSFEFKIYFLAHFYIVLYNRTKLDVFQLEDNKSAL